MADVGRRLGIISRSIQKLREEKQDLVLEVGIEISSLTIVPMNND